MLDLSRSLARMAAMAGLTLASAAALGQFTEPVLLVADSSGTTGRRVMVFSAADGSLVNAGFINLSSAVPGATTPKEVVKVNDELWVSDQVADRIDRFTLTGAYISSITDALLDNIRGMEFVESNQTVYVAVNGTAPTGVIARYNTSGVLQGTFNCIFSPFDVMLYDGTLLVTNSNNAGAGGISNIIERFSLDGTPLPNFNDGGGTYRFYQQMWARPNGNVLIGAFSGTVAGIYEFNPSGAQIDYIQTGTGLRGVQVLDNGNYFFTDATNARTRPPGAPSGAGSNTIVGNCNGQYITRINPPGPTACNPADIANTAGDTPGPDGCVNNGDFSLFFSSFFSADCAATCGLTPSTPCGPADIAQTDGAVGPDGCVDNGDFQLFFSIFFRDACTGCAG